MPGEDLDGDASPEEFGQCGCGEVDVFAHDKAFEVVKGDLAQEGVLAEHRIGSVDLEAFADEVDAEVGLGQDGCRHGCVCGLFWCLVLCCLVMEEGWHGFVFLARVGMSGEVRRAGCVRRGLGLGVGE
ncbi:MAG: hypothetical protein RMN51_12300 [Verrucomicrobiota bacterium]|nr:hypothetical protein [Verrucomicrobiota bacterium]